MDKDVESALVFLNKLALGTLIAGAITIGVQLSLRSCDSASPQDARPAAGVPIQNAKEENARITGNRKGVGIVDMEMRDKYREALPRTMKPPARGPESMKQKQGR